MLTTTPLPQQQGCSHPEAPRALRALPRGKTQPSVPDSHRLYPTATANSPVSLVEPSLQSSRCWENWKRRSRAFLAQETRRRCGQKRARCQEPAAGEKGLGRAETPRGAGEERLGCRGTGAQRGSPSRTSRTGSPAPSPIAGASGRQGRGGDPAGPRCSRRACPAPRAAAAGPRSAPHSRGGR